MDTDQIIALTAIVTIFFSCAVTLAYAFYRVEPEDVVYYAIPSHR